MILVFQILFKVKIKGGGGREKINKRILQYYLKAKELKDVEL